MAEFAVRGEGRGNQNMDAALINNRIELFHVLLLFLILNNNTDYNFVMIEKHISQ